MTDDDRSTRSIRFVDLGAQLSSIRDDVQKAIARVLDTGDFILGNDVARFEVEMAAYCEAKHAIGVDSGTSALELALVALDIGPGDEVVTAANTFIATALAISHTGATPVLVDIDPETYCIEPALLDAAITPNTKAIIPVHLYGHPADMDRVSEVAERNGLYVVEDASQAHGARYEGKRVGSLGHVAAFSLYPAKNLGAYGDAGVVVTNDSDIAESVTMLRNYGSRVKYHHELRGFNRRLDTLQAAVLRVKLWHLDAWNAARREKAAAYGDSLGAGEGSIVLPSTAPFADPVFHAYVVRSERRDELQDHLRRRGISTVIHYPIPIHLQPAYADLGYKRGDFPITEAFADRILSLPMYPELRRSDIDYVCDALSEFALRVKPSPAA